MAHARSNHHLGYYTLPVAARIAPLYSHYGVLGLDIGHSLFFASHNLAFSSEFHVCHPRCDTFCSEPSYRETLRIVQSYDGAWLRMLGTASCAKATFDHFCQFGGGAVVPLVVVPSHVAPW